MPTFICAEEAAREQFLTSFSDSTCHKSQGKLLQNTAPLRSYKLNAATVTLTTFLHIQVTTPRQKIPDLPEQVLQLFSKCRNTEKTLLLLSSMYDLVFLYTVQNAKVNEKVTDGSEKMPFNYIIVHIQFPRID